ncbi:MAG: copper resistance CopC family protein, partial [Thermomicrobiales bacterium]
MVRSALRPALVALALAAFVALEAPPRPALAHAEPERADPPIGGTVAPAPAMVEVWFTEEVDPAETTLSVMGPDGTTVDLGDSAVDLNDPERKRVTVSLPPDLAAGVYTVQWSALSGEDDHPEEGEFTFTVAGGSPVASPSASPAASPAAIPAASPEAAVVTGTPAAETAATDDEGDFDTQAFAIAVG